MTKSGNLELYTKELSIGYLPFGIRRIKQIRW